MSSILIPSLNIILTLHQPWCQSLTLVSLDSLAVALTFHTTKGGAPCNQNIEVHYGQKVESRDKFTMLTLNDLVWTWRGSIVLLLSSFCFVASWWTMSPWPCNNSACLVPDSLPNSWNLGFQEASKIKRINSANCMDEDFASSNRVAHGRIVKLAMWKPWLPR